MTSSVEIRGENAGDIAGIRSLVGAAFPTDAEARLIDALRAVGDLSVSLVAVDAGRIVGHVAFSPVTLDGAVIGLGLAPVAVDESKRRCGIASRLIEAGLERCRQFGCRFVVVLGDPPFYARFGYQPASHWGFRDKYGGGEAFQAIDFAPSEPALAGGTVRYAPAFSMFA
jgi:putative acetyltransferase